MKEGLRRDVKLQDYGRKNDNAGDSGFNDNADNDCFDDEDSEPTLSNARNSDHSERLAKRAI
jgi:hypothetical protein